MWHRFGTSFAMTYLGDNCQVISGNVQMFTGNSSRLRAAKYSSLLKAAPCQVERGTPCISNVTHLLLTFWHSTRFDSNFGTLWTVTVAIKEKGWGDFNHTEETFCHVLKGRWRSIWNHTITVHKEISYYAEQNMCTQDLACLKLLQCWDLLSRVHDSWSQQMLFQMSWVRRLRRPYFHSLFYFAMHCSALCSLCFSTQS